MRRDMLLCWFNTANHGLEMLIVDQISSLHRALRHYSTWCDNTPQPKHSPRENIQVSSVNDDHAAADFPSNHNRSNKSTRAVLNFLHWRNMWMWGRWNAGTWSDLLHHFVNRQCQCVGICLFLCVGPIIWCRYVFVCWKFLNLIQLKLVWLRNFGVERGSAFNDPNQAIW